MTDKLTLIAHLKAKPGCEALLGERLNALVAPTRTEAGCINYDIHQDKDDAAIWMLYENWRSKNDLDAHFETPYLREFLNDLADLLAEDMDIRFYRMTSSQVGPKTV